MVVEIQNHLQEINLWKTLSALGALCGLLFLRNRCVNSLRLSDVAFNKKWRIKNNEYRNGFMKKVAVRLDT